MKSKDKLREKREVWEVLKKAICPPDKRDTKHLIFAVLSLGSMLAAISIVIYYILGPMEGYLHSDYTDTMYWANASLESGKILDPNFRYAGILPFSANIWFIPYIAIFGFGMTAHKLGMITYLVLQSAAVWFMLRSFKWSVSSTSLTISAFLLLLSGSDKLREMMWGHVIYYSLAILLLCVGIGLFCRISEKRVTKGMFAKGSGGWKYVILLALSAILFGGNAINGLQLMALVTLPCIACALAEIFFSGKKKLLDPDNYGAYIGAFTAVISTGVGYFVLKKIQGDITASYTEYYSQISPPSQWIENARLLPKSWFTLMGCSVEKNSMMLEPESIKTILLAFVGAALIVIPIVGMLSYKKISDKGTRMLLWAHFAVSAVILFGYVCGTLGNANWRMLPMLATSILASAATVKHLAGVHPDVSLVPRRAAVLLAVLMLIGSLFNFRQMAKMDYDYGRNNTYHKLAAELESRGLEYGYASFWYSQSITLITDSRVKTRMIIADEDDGVTTDYYQNSFSWYEDTEDADKYFVLLSVNENTKVEKSDAWNEFLSEAEYEREDILNNFVLYVFDRNLDFPDPELFK